ncbi:pentatricopeptide repeat-containing protein At1g74630 [Argentina anserina]|uniref:pentatricopeptide repeat-containing protein At1g74630 n=1 Tax=Argentina anserina TaxID=57926 RepID=UPI0021768C35|nr:pentatricopeptide repeat-containing protein At1g74630 [Potentilla anserina]
MTTAEHIFSSLLTKCDTLNSVKHLHAFVHKAGLDTEPLLIGKLLLHCAVTIPHAALDYARGVLLHFPNPDAFMYNTLIRGLADSRDPRSALLLLREMRRGSDASPDSFTFAFALKAAANCRSLRGGMQLHCQALVRQFRSHLFVGTTLVSMYGECGRVGYARKVFDEMPEPNVVAWNAVLTACFRCGDVEGAEEVFGSMPLRDLTSWNIVLAGYVKAGELQLAREAFWRMPVRDDVSWSTMIVAFAQSGCFDEAFGFFRELQRKGVGANEASLTGVLSACAQAGAVEFGRILHGLVEKGGFLSMISVNNALLDMYSKSGNVEMARLVFERMPERKSVVSWTSMIAALAMHGYGKEAIQVFRKMEASGVRPDGITFISVLYACSHAGLVNEGCDYFSKMKEKCGIEPTIEHYGCMVDLYGRAGELQKAYDFVCQLPISPNAIIWRTLLGACSIHGNVELAEHVKEMLCKLDPENSGDHVLLSNVYAGAGKWRDVAAVRRSMSDRYIKKSPGWSVIEVDRVMYSFVAGDITNKITEEAYEKLREIMLNLRFAGGYLPEVGSVLHDIETEDKEDSVFMHSEKLAVAFGLARLPEGRMIRIVKNLRVCRDCHTVMKLISKLYRSEIVVRDRSRFHSFKDGSCSCNDYW